MTPAAAELGFTRLTGGPLLALLGILAGYVVATEVGKRWFYARRS
jgi:hypothetical protein